MTPHYSYTPSEDFINNLNFEFIETYSLQRGSEYEAWVKEETKELESFEARKSKENNLSKVEITRLDELDKRHNYQQYLIDSNGLFHPSAKKIGTFKKGHQIVEKLISILNTTIKEIPSWMCGPVYRDVVVFYNAKNEIEASLNVCFSCEYMETKMFSHIHADVETYKLLKELFIEIGHEVELE
ncbi:MAG: hypothetical protein AB8F95_04535 [Bacteroidia bacterium]